MQRSTESSTRCRTQPTAAAKAGSVTETIVHLVRHGEVDNPTACSTAGCRASVLSEAGEQMAEVAASALAGHDVTVVRSSPLERAVQTAAPIAEEFGIDADDRRPADRERELLRGQDVRRR